MKNYLFAPFKGGDEKIKAFNELKSTILSCINEENIDTNYVTNALIVFMGSLESYYDCITTHLKEEKDGLSVRCDELKAELKDAKYYSKEMIKKLQVEKEELKAWNEEMKAEIDGLRCSDDVRKLRISRKKNEKLQAENDKLKHELKHKAIKLNQSHYPKEYQAEADEWFEHNPQDEKLFFFMVGGSGVDEDGDVINTLNVGADAIAECDNYKGVISVETYK